VWNSYTDYEKRKAAILAHERKHVDDMKKAFDEVAGNLAALEGEKANKEECEKAGAEAVEKQTALWVKRAQETQDRHDPPRKPK
jgi:hypothetical protein